MGQKLRQAEAAEYCRISRNHLNQINHRGDGPPRIRISDRVFIYDTDSLDAWLAGREEPGRTRDPISA